MKKNFLKVSLFFFLAASILVHIFYKGSGQVSGIQSQNKDELPRGLILPHHDLAEELFHTSLETISKKGSPQMIVLLGTNHYLPESPTFLTTLTDGMPYKPFDNPENSNPTYNFTTYKIANDQVRSIVNIFPDISIRPEILEKEHSIGVPISYIAYYFPDSQIIPFIISPRYDESKVIEKARYLAQNLPEDTLYVATVDFAHGVILEEGLKNNDESIKAIENFDYKKIMKFSDTNLDSPVAISIFLKIMEELGSKKWTTIKSSHGALLTNNLSLQGTSYVVGSFE